MLNIKKIDAIVLIGLNDFGISLSKKFRRLPVYSKRL
jgi:hypothetical protein